MASRTPFLRLVALVGIAVSGPPLHRGDAQSVSNTDPLGVVTIALPAQSDTRVSIPFVRPARYAGTVQSSAGNVLTVAGSPNWSADQFAFNAGAGQHDTFFVLLGAHPGANGPTPKEGCFYTVTANGTNTLTLEANGDDLSAVQPGTRVTLIPYWTLGTAFPASDAGKSFLASASLDQLATTVTLPGREYSVPQVRNPNGPPLTYVEEPTTYYFCDGAWRNVFSLSPAEVFDDTVLVPDAHFVVRNTATTALVMHPAGVVLMGKFTALVQASILAYPAALPRPLSMTLNDLGLFASGAIRPTEQQTGDSVSVYDNTVSGYNKAPSATFYYSGGAWHQTGGQASQDFGPISLWIPGSGLLFSRRVSNGSTVFWQNAPNYPAGNP